MVQRSLLDTLLAAVPDAGVKPKVTLLLIGKTIDDPSKKVKNLRTMVTDFPKKLERALRGADIENSVEKVGVQGVDKRVLEDPEVVVAVIYDGQKIDLGGRDPTDVNKVIYFGHATEGEPALLPGGRRNRSGWAGGIRRTVESRGSGWCRGGHAPRL